MSDFKLLSQLCKTSESKPEHSKIRYQQYVIECEDKEIAILVPLRESDHFEESMVSYDGSEQQFRALLRKHRIIRDY